MKIVTNQEEALEAIAECEKTINENLAAIKEIAAKFNLTVNINLNQPETSDWENSGWQSSGINC